MSNETKHRPFLEVIEQAPNGYVPGDPPPPDYCLGRMADIEGGGKVALINLAPELAHGRDDMYGVVVINPSGRETEFVIPMSGLAKLVELFGEDMLTRSMKLREEAAKG